MAIVKGHGMIKELLLGISVFTATSAFACTNALPTDDANFCSSFKSTATCYCISSGVPSGMCQDMFMLYYRMMSVFGTLQKACEYQTYTSTQDCINNWNCYLHGGVDSNGHACNGGTQRPCQ